MFFRFCKLSILKWQYGIYAFSCFKFITGLWPTSFFFTRNKLLTNSPYDGWTFLMDLFFNISFTSSSTNSSPFWLTIVGKGFLTEKVLNEVGFCILLLCPKSWDPVLFLSRLQQNVSIFLPMERLEYFLTRIIFLSMGEPFLIPTELVFLDLNPCWRRSAVE